MKFSCPECQAKYQVELPPAGEEGVEVKCARCEHVFHVHEEAPSAVAAGNTVNEGNDDFDSAIPDQGIDPSLAGPDDNLDAFLDDLIEQEITDPQPSSEKTATAADTSLDGLLDDLLTEDSPVNETSGLDNQELDQIWKDSVAEGQKEEETAQIEETPVAENDVQIDEPPAAEALDENPSPENVLEDETTASETLEQTKPSEPEETNPEQTPADMDNMSEEDAWAAAFADQEATETEQETGTEESTEDTVPDMNNMSEEDAWAAAFADQEATETEQEAGTEESSEDTAPDMDNMSEEDAWAAAFADQEATETEQETGTEESSEDTAPDMDNMSEEDAWAAAFADQEATETGQEREETKSADEGEESEEDLWAKAFEDQASVEESQAAEPDEGSDEGTKETAADTSEEDLWEQAFNETGGGDTDTGTAPSDETTSEPAGDNAMGEDVSDEEMEKLAALAHDDGDGPSLADEALANYNEDDYADFDEDEFETEAPRKKKGFIPMPSGKTGKLVVGGGILALLLIGGSAYFAIQTFAPPELVEEGQIAQTEGEGATDETAGEENETAGEGEKEPSAVEEAQNALLEEESEPAAEPSTEASAIEEPAPNRALDTALSPFADIVEMSTILPVAYSATDIKVLSFTIHLEMDTPGTAENMRNSLPVYEKIMVATVENFLKRKFYNDILYVKEKLVKRLERAINKGLKQGKIKKAKFKDFQIS